MELKYCQHLDKFKQIAQWYSENLKSYSRQINIDIDLSTSSKPKMKSLVEEFIMRSNDFIKAVEAAKPIFSRIDEGIATANKDSLAQYDIIYEEFTKLHKSFEKISVTTPKLLEIKQRIDEKIKLYENLQRKNNLTPHKTFQENRSRSKLHDDSQDVNDKWLDSLINDVSQKNEKLKSFVEEKKNEPVKKTQNTRSTIFSPNQQVKRTASTPMKENTVPKYIPATKNVSNYLTGFKIIQDEFANLKEQLKQLVHDQKTHNHAQIEQDVQKLLTTSTKIETDNKVIQREHSELLHAMHILSKRMDLLEKENNDLKGVVKNLSEQVAQQQSISEQPSATNRGQGVILQVAQSSANKPPHSPSMMGKGSINKFQKEQHSAVKLIESQKKQDLKNSENEQVSDWVAERLKK